MQKKQISILACLLLTCALPSAFALSIFANPNEIEKGGSISITGNAKQGTVQLTIFAENSPVKEKQINTNEEGFFSLDYSTSFSEPSGKWKITATQGEDKNTVYFNVSQIEESAFLFIKFFSPSKQSFVSTEKIPVSVKITDSGNNVERANVFAWLSGTEKILIKESSQGFYEEEIHLPASLQPGDYNLIVAAEKVVAKRFGGENRIKISVTRPEIILKVLTPTLYKARIEKPVEISILPEYNTGARTGETEIVAEISGKKIGFEKKGESYHAAYTPNESELGSLKISVFATDNFGNSGKKEILLEITGFQENFLEKNFGFIGISIIAAVITVFIALNIFGKRKSRKAKENKKNEITKKIRNTEERFYKEPLIDRKTFEENLSKLKEELNELQRKD